MNFMDVYKKGMPCGHANEYYSVFGGIPKQSQVAQITTEDKITVCQDYFMKLNTSKCANTNIGEFKGSWCFVKDTCNDIRVPKRDDGLKGGSVFYLHNKKSSGIAWKNCEDHVDKQLKEVRPTKMNQFAVNHSLNPYTHMSFSYQKYSKFPWSTVDKFITRLTKSNHKDKGEDLPGLKEFLMQFKDRDDAAVFTDNDLDEPPYHILHNYGVLRFAPKTKQDEQDVRDWKAILKHGPQWVEKNGVQLPELSQAPVLTWLRAV
jgi:hypothetical protein